MSKEYLTGLKSKLIAVVDDEQDIIELVSVNLKKNGFNVVSFNDGSGLFEYLQKTLPDLVILDLMLPDYDGFEICKYLKNDPRTAKIPIIMLTARGDETDKILGLEIGADDYLTKPFSPRELVARVKVIFRRGSNAVNSSTLIVINDILEIDTEKYEVKIEGNKIDLTPTEYKILKLLAERYDKVCSRERIIDYIGSQEKGVFDRTVDVHIKNLRDKLGKAAVYVKNIRGVGYKLEGM